MILTEISINRKIFRLVLGSIIEESTEAIINPANEQLHHTGGVARLISQAGGPKIQEESDDKAPVPTGSSSFTKAGRLPFKYIIHTVGPVYKGGSANEAELLRSAVTSALETADILKLESVSMPAISTGIFGYPLEPAIRIIYQAISDFMGRTSTLEEIHLCEFDRDKADRIEEILKPFCKAPSCL